MGVKGFLSLREKIDINSAGKIQKAVAGIDPKHVVPGKRLLWENGGKVRAALRERFPDDFFREHWDGIYVTAGPWWPWTPRAMGPLYMQALENQRRLITAFVEKINWDTITDDSVVFHTDEWDPKVTLEVLGKKFPKDKFGYGRCRFNYRFRVIK